MIKTVVVLLAAGWIGVKMTPLPESLVAPVAAPAEKEEADDSLRGGGMSRVVALREVPRNLIEATLAAEDQRFFDHKGVDAVALGRAVVNDLRRWRVTSGASTITEQLVKISDPRPRTPGAKLLEMARALRLEQLWTKDQILTAYLNRLDFGNHNVGIAAAAGYYFGKPLAELTNGEAAFLAGLPKNPAKLNPYLSFALAKRRQETVLRRMQASGWLTPQSAALAIREPLKLQPRRSQIFYHAHLGDLVVVCATDWVDGRGE